MNDVQRMVAIGFWIGFFLGMLMISIYFVYGGGCF